MREELNIKIDNLITNLDNDPRITEIEKLKKELLTDSNLLDKITKLKTLDKYSSEYKTLKQELFQNNNFVRFKELENEIDFLILEINKKLNILTNERRCSHENN